MIGGEEAVQRAAGDAGEIDEMTNRDLDRGILRLEAMNTGQVAEDDEHLQLVAAEAGQPALDEVAAEDEGAVRADDAVARAAVVRQQRHVHALQLCPDLRAPRAQPFLKRHAIPPPFPIIQESKPFLKG